MAIYDVSGSAEEATENFDANQKGMSVVLHRKIAGLLPENSVKLEFSESLFYIVIDKKVAILKKSQNNTHIFIVNDAEAPLKPSNLTLQEKATSEKKTLEAIGECLTVLKNQAQPAQLQLDTQPLEDKLTASAAPESEKEQVSESVKEGYTDATIRLTDIGNRLRAGDILTDREAKSIKHLRDQLDLIEMLDISNEMKTQGWAERVVAKWNIQMSRLASIITLIKAL